MSREITAIIITYLEHNDIDSLVHLVKSDEVLVLKTAATIAYPFMLEYFETLCLRHDPIIIFKMFKIYKDYYLSCLKYKGNTLEIYKLTCDRFDIKNIRSVIRMSDAGGYQRENLSSIHRYEDRYLKILFKLMFSIFFPKSYYKIICSPLVVNWITLYLGIVVIFAQEKIVTLNDDTLTSFVKDRKTSLWRYGELLRLI